MKLCDTVGLCDCRLAGLLACGDVWGLWGCRAVWISECRSVGLWGCGTMGLWGCGPVGTWGHGTVLGYSVPILGHKDALITGSRNITTVWKQFESFYSKSPTTTKLSTHKVY